MPSELCFAITAIFLEVIYTYQISQYTNFFTSQCPVLVIHGKQDDVIPFKNGIEIFDRLTQSKEKINL